MFSVDEAHISEGDHIYFPQTAPLLDQNTSLSVRLRCFQLRAYMNWLQVESQLAGRLQQKIVLYL